MIRSFHDKDTERVYNKQSVRRWQSFERIAYRKLVHLDTIKSLQDLKGSGNLLEKLEEDRIGQHGFRINDKWRICFIWKDGDAYRVEITDYH